MLIDVASAVVADVDDDPLGVPEPIDFILEAPQRRLVHRADVHVGDLPVGHLFHELAVALHPLLVLDVPERVGRADTDLSPVGSGRGGRDREGHVVVEDVIENSPVVVLAGDLLAFNCQDVIARLQLDPLLVRGAIPIDVGDHKATIRRLHLEAQQMGGVGSGQLQTGRPPNASVRGIQLPDHLVREVVDVVVLAHVLQERPVPLPHREPIHTVHLRVVEPVVHDPPTLLEKLAPFSLLVHGDRELKGNPALLLGAQRHLVDAAALPVERCLAIRGQGEAGEGTVGNQGPVFSVDADGVQPPGPLAAPTASAPAAPLTSDEEVDLLAVHGQDRARDPIVAPGQLHGPASDAICVHGQPGSFPSLLLILLAPGLLGLLLPLAHQRVVRVFGLSRQGDLEQMVGPPIPIRSEHQRLSVRSDRPARIAEWVRGDVQLVAGTDLVQVDIGVQVIVLSRVDQPLAIGRESRDREPPVLVEGELPTAAGGGIDEEQAVVGHEDQLLRVRGPPRTGLQGLVVGHLPS